MPPTTPRWAGAMPACARSSSRCAGRCSTSIRPSSGSPAAKPRSSARCAADAGLAREFAAAFPGGRAPVTMDNVIRAIAAYERTLFAGGSAVRPLRVRAASTRRSMTRRSAACSCSSPSAAAAPAAMAASTSPGTGWIASTRGPRPCSPTPAPGRRCACPRCAISPPPRPTCTMGASPALDAVLDHYERLAARSRGRHAACGARH